MTDGPVTLSIRGGVATVTLSRPEKANALGPAGRLALRDAVTSAEADGTTRALVLTGAGSRVFCAGADLDEAPGAMTVQAARAFNADWAETTGLLAGSRLLTVARINGVVAGGGVALAIACDLRVAVPDMTAFYPALARGVLPPPEDAARLAALVGPAHAKALLLAGQRVDSAEALGWGLIDAVATAERIDERIQTFLAGALTADPGHLRALKAAVGGALHDPEALDAAYCAVYGHNTAP